MNRWGLGVLWLVAALPVAASFNPALSPDVPSMAREQGRSVLLSEQVIDLSLSDAVYLGLRNNRGIRSAYLQRIAQKFDLRVAADAFNPKLVVRGDYRANRATEDRTRTSNVSPTATLLGEYGTRFSLAWVKQFRTADEAGRYRSDGLDLTVVQPLLRDAGWDVTTAPLRLARLSEDANRLQLKASVSQTISQVIGAYRELLRAQEQARIAREALARTQELLEVNRAMIRAGRMAEFEIVQTEADVASQELNVEESANQVDSARLALLQLLALDLSTQIRASDALAATPIEVDRQQAIRTALQQQPEYLQRLIGSRQADLNLVLAKNQRLWDVSLVGGASQIRDRYSEGGGDTTQLGQLRRGTGGNSHRRPQPPAGRGARPGRRGEPEDPDRGCPADPGAERHRCGARPRHALAPVPDRPARHRLVAAQAGDRTGKAARRAFEQLPGAELRDRPAQRREHPIECSDLVSQCADAARPDRRHDPG